MASVIKTVLTYPLNGSTRDFTIPFEYLARKFVTVTLLGKDRKPLTLNTDFRFATRTVISTTKAWGPADGYSQIELRRVTSATERLVDFTDGSILRAYDLNVAQIQTMHVAEEARDMTADTIGVNNDGDLDARNRRIVNVANAVDDRDAVPFGQLKTMNQNSWQARNEAQGFRNEAQTFRNQAETFKNQAGASESAAATYKNDAQAARNTAEQHKNNAASSASSASNSASAASRSQGAAATSESNALAQANRAKSEADRAKTEADKLGNWNAIAGTIDSVDGTNVTFKSNVITKGTVTVKGTGIEIYGSTPYIDFHFGNSDADYTHRLICGESVFNFNKGLNVNGGIASNTVVGIAGKDTFLNAEMVKIQNPNFGDRWASMRMWGNATRANVCEWSDGQGWLMYVQRKTWGSSDINFSVNGTVNCTDLTCNTLKGLTRIGAGDAYMGTNGDIRGSLWGGTIYDWLKANTVSYIHMGAVQTAQIWNAKGVNDGGGKVLTGAYNSNADAYLDGVHWRVMQYVRNNGTKYNIY